MFKEMVKEFIQFVKSVFPIATQNREIKLDNVYTDASKIPDVSDYQIQKRYRLEGRSLSVPVYADFTLYEKGKVVAKAQKLLIARVPLKLPRGTYLFKGNEFFVANQLRLKPGIYVRIRENGEVEAHFNLAKWTFKAYFNGSKVYAKFTRGPAIPYYTLLKLFGASEDEIKNAFGELYNENILYDEDAILGWYRAYYGEGTKEEAVKTFKSILSSGYRFDPEISRHLLNIEASNINKDVLLAALKKLIAVRRGEKEPDDRDALFFKQLLEESDILSEHFHNMKSKVIFKIRRNLVLKDKIRDIVPIAVFQSVVDNVFTKDLVNPLKQTNPVTIAENNSRVTIFGEGGIKSEYAVPYQARALNPSHFGIVDPVRTPESSKVGAVLFRTIGAGKDPKTGLPATEVLDVKTGKLKRITSTEFFNSRVAFPDQIKEVKNGKVVFKNKSQVKILYRGNIEIVPASKVDYVVPNYMNVFTVSTLFLPFLQSLHPNRASKAANTITQALPLKYREPPLVQSAISENLSMVDIVGRQYSVRSPVDGEIKSVKNNVIVIKDKKGKEHKISLADYLPLNQNSFISMEIKENIKPGVKVKKGDLLADTNFTKDGQLALGVNAITALMPFKHLNFEDGIVVSESFAKKLTSQRLFHFRYPLGSDVKIDKELYRSLYPHELLEDNYKKLDEDGIIKKGAVVKDGDILIAGLVKKKESKIDEIIARLNRRLVQPWVKKPLIWDKEFDGIVKDVIKTKQFISITVLTEEPAIVGDKLTNSHGSKGVIVHIIPDDQMPKLPDGRTVEVIINPVSILGRNNPSQVYEMVAGKVAEKLKQPLKIPAFGVDDTHKLLKNLTKQYGVSDTETLIDPVTGKKIPNVMVGPMYIYKLEHQVEEKMSARYKGAYDQWDMTPAKGVDEPGQAVGLMEIYALLAHGAGNVLKEMATWKSERNPLFWEAIENNLPPPPPKTTFVTKKFENLLRAAGIDVKKEGHLVRIMPLTQSQVKSLTQNRFIKNAKMVVAGTLKEESGGLFDPELTGGLRGDKWAAIKLPDKLPSPIVLRVFSLLLNMKEKDIKDIILGVKKIQGMSGSEAILKLLKSKSLDEYLKQAQDMADVAKRSNNLNELNKANLIIRFIKYMKENNIKWEEFFLDRLPVLPPQFRPVYVDKHNRLFHSDFNLVYRDIKLLADQIQRAKQEGLPEDEINKMKKDLYESIEILYGLADPSSRYYGKRKPRGILDYIHGPKPKEGYYQHKVLRKTQDLSGRSVIVPNPGLHPDEIGIPEEMAWKIFEPFILAKLKSEFAMSPAEARIELANRGDKARKALELVASERLVIVNRAPSLHKYNMLAFKPKIVPGHAIHFPNVVVSMQSGDYDGNSLAGDEYVIYSLKDEIYFRPIKDFPREDSPYKISKRGVKYFKVPPGIKVLAYDYNTNTLKWDKVSSFSEHPVQKVYKVKTYHGASAVVTGDHSLLVFDPRDYTFKRMSPLEIMRNKNRRFFVVRPKKIRPLVEVPRIKLGDLELDLDFELGYLIGCYVGDGWVDNRNGFYIASMDNGIYGKLKRLIKRKFNVAMKARKAVTKIFKGYEATSRKLYANLPKEFRRFLKENCGSKASDKKLPSPIYFCSPVIFRLGLLSGLLDTDGTVHQSSEGRFTILYNTISEVLADEVRILALSLGIRSTIKKVKNTDGVEYFQIIFSCKDLAEAVFGKGIHLRLYHTKKKKILSKLFEVKRDKRFNGSLFNIVPISEELIYLLNYSYRKGSRFSADFILDTIKREYVPKEMISSILHNVHPRHEHLKKQFELLKAFIETDDVWFDFITEVIPQQEVPTYDLTTESKTFLCGIDFIVYDTTAIHVPVTQEALQDAVKLLPSQNWLHEGRPKEIWLTPKIEAIWGLYKITRDGKDKSKQFKFNNVDDALRAFHRGDIDITDTVVINNQKTTLGRALVNRILPKDFRDPNIKLDKTTINKLMRNIFEKYGGKEGARVAGELNKLGGDFAYLIGFKLSLDDFSPKFEDLLDKAFVESLKTKDPSKINRKAMELRQKIMKSLMKQDDNTLVQLVKSGTRAKKDSLMQLLASPVQLADVYDRPIPVIVPRGYAKGMDTIDYLFASYGARKGAIEKTVKTGEPGELSKELVAAAIDYVITMEDCGTRKGIVMDVDKADALNRALAENVVKNGKIIAKRNEIVDGKVYEKLKESGVKQVKVRSPLTCEAPDGICVLCYGAKPDGTMPHIGEYVGIKSAQYLSEPVTQMTISSVHTGGLVKDMGTSFQDIRAVMEMSNVPARATVAKVAGKVEKIVKRPEGGYEIIIDGKSHITSPWVEPKVKEGDEVAKGDILTTGLPHPKDIYDAAGLEAARNFVVNYLDTAYQQNGMKLDRRHFEIIGKVMFDTAVVTDPGDTDLVPGDYVKINKLKALNAQMPPEIDVSLEDAAGRILATPVDKYPAGTKLTSEIIDDLRKKKIKTVKVRSKPASFKPVVKGIEQLPLLRDDWLTRMAYRDIKNTAIEGALRSWSSDLQGYSPIPKLVYGETP